MSGNEVSGRYRDAMCPGCGSILTGSREPGDTDTCQETGEEVELIAATLENRLDFVDAIALEDHPFEAAIEVRALLTDETSAEQWEEHLEWFAKTEFSDLSCVVDVEVSDRDRDTASDHEEDGRR